MGQSFLRMKDRSKTSLEINNPISTQILCLFVRNPLQRLFGLHHRDRMGKAFQILRETPLIRSAKEPLRKGIRIVRGQARVFDIPGQICDALRPQNAIQMLVQKDFGKTYQ